MVQSSNNTGLAVMHPLSAWSWKDILDTYSVLGRLMNEYSGVHRRIGVPKPNIRFLDHENIFFIRFWSDVRRIEEQLKALDHEIARRNKLIGVVG